MKNTNFEAADKFVEFGISEKAKGRRESASGPGSSLEATLDASKFLESVLRSYEISSLLDLGCGDWNWMRHVNLVGGNGVPVKYWGWDANERLVTELNQRHGGSNCRFELRDIVLDDFPAVDLILARDVLFHMPVSMASKVIEKAKLKCNYFLSTSFPSQAANTEPRPYLPIEGWGFARINLDTEPFSLADRKVASVEEVKCSHEGHARHFCLFDFRKTL